MSNYMMPNPYYGAQPAVYPTYYNQAYYGFGQSVNPYGMGVPTPGMNWYGYSNMMGYPNIAANPFFYRDEEIEDDLMDLEDIRLEGLPNIEIEEKERAELEGNQGEEETRSIIAEEQEATRNVVNEVQEGKIEGEKEARNIVEEGQVGKIEGEGEARNIIEEDQAGNTEAKEATRNLTEENLLAMQQGGRGHTHAHYGATTCEDGHTHLHPGVTGGPIPTQGGHVHKIYGHTSFDDGHIHSYEEYTSPAIPLPNGYHTHYAEIRTTENDGHIHIIRGFIAASKS